MGFLRVKGVIMTEAQAQAIIQTLYEGDTDTPTALSEDYLARRALLNAAISIWETEEYWRELCTDLATSDVSLGGVKTTTNATSAYATPTDFKFPLGYVWIGTTAYTLIPAEDITLVTSTDSTSQFYRVTGNKSSGYKVTIHPTPTSTGDTIRYEYYKSATQLSAVGTVFEMSDPYFAIYFTLSELYKQDGKSDDAGSAMALAKSRLDRMKEINVSPGFYQENAVKDSAFARGVEGFGH